MSKSYIYIFLYPRWTLSKVVKILELLVLAEDCVVCLSWDSQTSLDGGPPTIRAKKEQAKKNQPKNWHKKPRVCRSWDSQTSLDGGPPTIWASPLRPPRTILGFLSGSSWANPHPSPDKNLLQKRAFWDHQLKLLTRRPFPVHKTFISKSDIKRNVMHIAHSH